MNDFDDRAKRFDLKIQLEKAKRFIFLRSAMATPEDSFEEAMQRDINRFYKDINMSVIRNRQTLRAEILRVGNLMKRENLKSNNRDFLRVAGDNFIAHAKSIEKFFVFIVEGKNVFRDAKTGKYVSTKTVS